MQDDDTLYRGIPGGPALLDWFGRVPRFHDAEIVELSLRRRSDSILRVHFWNFTGEVDDGNRFMLDRHVVVTFAMAEIMDLHLDGFSGQNVIYGLELHRAQDRPERRPFYTLTPSPDDYEIELKPCFGMDGHIRFRGLAITFAPGKPEDAPTVD